MMQLNCLHWCSILRRWKLWKRKTKILLSELKKYNSDTFILDIILNGLELDFNEIPFQRCGNNYQLWDSKIKDSKKAIVNTDKRTGDYISGVFIRRKDDGSHRMILNLKNFNKLICYRHFKMESIQNVLNMIKIDAFMASNDLKDAFHSVPVVEHHQKYQKSFCELVS